MEKEKNRYIFPSVIARKMKNIDLRAQLEASMLSLSLLLIGMILYMVYIIFYTPSSWWQKGMLIFNMLCGVVLMSTYLITSYQQYSAYMETLGIDTDKEKELIKDKGNIFKRIMLAIKERKKAKQAENTLNNLDKLLEKSGIGAELKSKEEFNSNKEEMKGGEELIQA